MKMSLGTPMCRGWGARRFSPGCKLRILASLRVSAICLAIKVSFGVVKWSHYSFHFSVCVRMVSLWGSKGALNFPTSIPAPFT